MTTPSSSKEKAREEDDDDGHIPVNVVDVGNDTIGSSRVMVAELLEADSLQPLPMQCHPLGAFQVAVQRRVHAMEANLWFSDNDGYSG